MSGVYGGPVGAAAHEAAFHWYGGGAHGIVRRPALIGVGDRGAERVDISPAGQPLVVFEVGGVRSNGLEQMFIDWLRNAIRVRGGGATNSVQRALGQTW